jgi:hypothetical protein
VICAGTSMRLSDGAPAMAGTTRGVKSAIDRAFKQRRMVSNTSTAGARDQGRLPRKRRVSRDKRPCVRSNFSTQARREGLPP